MMLCWRWELLFKTHSCCCTGDAGPCPFSELCGFVESAEDGTGAIRILQAVAALLVVGRCDGFLNQYGISHL